MPQANFTNREEREKIRPYLNSVNTKLKSLTGQFKGLYTSYGEGGCPEGYSPYMKNISALSYPVLKSREGRECVGEFEGEIVLIGVVLGKYLFCIEFVDDVCYMRYLQEDGTWKRIENAVKADTGRYDMIYFINTSFLLCGAIYTVNGIDKGQSFSFKETEEGLTSTVENNIPYSDMLATIDGRIAAALTEKSTLYLGGIMDRKVWFDINDGLQLEVITQKGENVSAIYTYGGRLMVFKPHAFGELYGNSTDTYTFIMSSESIGCLEKKTICDCGKLLWLSDEGICSYGGGATPEIISSPVQKYIDNLDRERLSTACAGYDGERYIISLPQKGGSKINLVLNVKSGIFTAEDDTDFRCFTNMGSHLYGGTADGKIIKLFTESESVFWEWQSPVYKMDIEKPMNLSRIYIDGEFEGDVTVSVITDKGLVSEQTFTVLEKRESGSKRFCVRLHPKDFFGCKSYQLFLKGEGKMKIENISVLLRKKNTSYGGK